MFHNSAAIRQFFKVALGVAVLTGLEIAVYALIGRFSVDVLLGALFGMAVSCANFLALTMTVSRAADRAEEGGDPMKARAAVQGSSVLRLLVLAGGYILVLKFTTLDPLASVLPLIFVQISISLMEFFRKDGEKNGSKRS